MIDMNQFKINKNKFINLCLSVIILIFTLIFSFAISSCKSQGNGILGSQVASTSTEDPDIKNALFAYDFAADTISYNSCVITPPAVASPTLHGLKIGSSEGFIDNLGTGAVKGGLKLRSDFLQYVGQKFPPAYPSNTVTPAQVMKVLGQNYSIMNNGAKLQFAIRKKSDYTAIPDLIAPPFPMTVVPDVDAKVFPQNLAAGFLGFSITKSILYNITGGVLAEGPRTYNLSDTVDPVPIEFAFNLNATADSTYASPSPIPIPTEPFGALEAYSQKVRDNFNAGSQILAVTFGGEAQTTGVPATEITSDTINNIKRPYQNGTNNFDMSKAFGRGYSLKFDSRTAVTTWPKNQLTQVTEINLDTGTPTGNTTWSCESFVIAHPTHWNNTRSTNPNWVKNSTNIEPNCAPLISEDTTCLATDLPSECVIKTNRNEKIKRLRRHYSATDWNIGLMFQTASKSGYVPPRRISLEMCVSPKNNANSCYLPTAGILTPTANAPDPATDLARDVGIEYDRLSGRDCYMSMATITSNRDTERMRGRCAAYASICIRNSFNY